MHVFYLNSLQEFTGGCTNQLIGCVYRPSDSSETTYTNENTFLVRIYGNNSEVLIDRNEEIQNIILLHSSGFGTELYATFNNGIAYGFSAGETVTVDSIYEERVWRGVARRMGQLHRDVRKEGQDQAEAYCWIKIREFQSLMPKVFTNDAIQKR